MALPIPRVGGELLECACSGDAASIDSKVRQIMLSAADVAVTVNFLALRQAPIPAVHAIDKASEAKNTIAFSPAVDDGRMAKPNPKRTPSMVSASPATRATLSKSPQSEPSGRSWCEMSSDSPCRCTIRFICVPKGVQRWLREGTPRYRS